MRRDSTADAVNIQFGSREHARLVVGVLEGLYPEAICSLEYSGEPWKLLIMGRLSAQCTDTRVNIVCRELFSRFPTLGDVADAPLSELEEIIRPCGLFRHGRGLKNSARTPLLSARSDASVGRSRSP